MVKKKKYRKNKINSLLAKERFMSDEPGIQKINVYQQQEQQEPQQRWNKIEKTKAENVLKYYCFDGSVMAISPDRRHCKFMSFFVYIDILYVIFIFFFFANIIRMVPNESSNIVNDFSSFVIQIYIFFVVVGLSFFSSFLSLSPSLFFLYFGCIF